MGQGTVECFYTLIGKPLARLRDLRKRFRHELAICAIFRNEARYLEEWLTFHHGVGVDHFYLYNNISTDDSLAVLRPWVERGLVTLIDWPPRGQQVEAYGDCIKRFRKRARWIAFIDIDEFLFSPRGPDLKKVLRKYADVSAIFVYWVMFGSGGHVSRPAGSVLEAYTRCLDKESAKEDTFDHRKEPGHVNYVTGWAQDGKSIINPRLVRRFIVHKPRDLWHGTTVDENRRAPEQRILGASISHSVFRINHYWSRSIEDLTKKVARGRVNSKNPPSKALDRWLARERTLNTAEDTTILDTWRAIQLQTAQKTVVNHD